MMKKNMTKKKKNNVVRSGNEMRWHTDNRMLYNNIYNRVTYKRPVELMRATFTDADSSLA